MKQLPCLTLSVFTVLTITTITTSLVIVPSLIISMPTRTSSVRVATSLFATPKKKIKKKRSAGAGGGFGGASMEPCPCGSSESYSRCCGRIHKDVNAYKSATASEVVRARYSAYAKKQADFLMASTHPLHKDFDADLKRWKEQIK